MLNPDRYTGECGKTPAPCFTLSVDLAKLLNEEERSRYITSLGNEIGATFFSQKEGLEAQIKTLNSQYHASMQKLEQLRKGLGSFDKPMEDKYYNEILEKIRNGGHPAIHYAGALTKTQVTRIAETLFSRRVDGYTNAKNDSDYFQNTILPRHK